jgi:hypothetical protein
MANDEWLIIAMYGSAFVVYLTIRIVFLTMMTSAITHCDPRNRVISVPTIWIGLIPCVDLVMDFIIVNKVSESLDREFEDRDLEPLGDLGKSTGTMFATFRLLGTMACAVFTIAAVVYLVLYWMKLTKVKQLLRYASGDGDFDADDQPELKPRRRREEDDEEDDEFARFRRRKRRQQYDDDDQRDPPKEPAE